MNMRVTQPLTINVTTETANPTKSGLPDSGSSQLLKSLANNQANGGNSTAAAGDLPNWAKSLVKKMLGDSSSGNLPSSSTAANTIRDFQKQNNIGLLSSDQVKQMADTGYCKMADGSSKQVPPDVQGAAQKMMENNGELFKKLESAIRGSHDGLLSTADYDAALKDGTIGQPGTSDLPKKNALDPATFFKSVMDGVLSHNRPTEYNAAKLINDFQKQNTIGPLNQQQLSQMANHGFVAPGQSRVLLVSPEIQLAAKKMLENNGEMFKKLQSPVAIQPNGGNLPSGGDAAKSIRDFQNQNNIGLLGVDQVKQMADTGYCKMADGSSKQVPPDVQGAAQKMMENNGELFKKLESAIRGSHDGLLSTADYDAALKDGAISAPGKGGNADAVNAVVQAVQDILMQTLLKNMLKDELQKVLNDGGLGMPDGKSFALPKLVLDILKGLMDGDAEDEGDDDSASNNMPAININIRPPAQAANGGIGISIGSSGSASRPTDEAAAKTMHDFEMKNNIYTLDKSQMQQMADTGKLTLPGNRSITVSPQEQAAAKKMLEDGGKLFDKLESANTGEKDGRLAAVDYDKAAEKKMLDLPAVDANTAAKSIDKFQLDNNIYMLDKKQMQQMVDKGTVSVPGNNNLEVSTEVRAAAKKMLEDGGKLFDKLEAANTGAQDGKLTPLDYDKGLEKKMIAAPAA